MIYHETTKKLETIAPIHHYSSDDMVWNSIARTTRVGTLDFLRGFNYLDIHHDGMLVNQMYWDSTDDVEYDVHLQAGLEITIGSDTEQVPKLGKISYRSYWEYVFFAKSTEETDYSVLVIAQDVYLEADLLGELYHSSLPHEVEGFLDAFWIGLDVPSEDLTVPVTVTLDSRARYGGEHAFGDAKSDWLTYLDLNPEEVPEEAAPGEDGIGWYDPDTNSIPEPSTFVTFTGLLGMGLIGCWRRRRKR